MRLSLESGFFFFLIPLDAFDIQVSSETRFGLQEAKTLSRTPGSRATKVQFLVLLCDCLSHPQIHGIFLIETRRSGFDLTSSPV